MYHPLIWKMFRSQQLLPLWMLKRFVPFYLTVTVSSEKLLKASFLLQKKNTPYIARSISRSNPGPRILSASLLPLIHPHPWNAHRGCTQKITTLQLLPQLYHKRCKCIASYQLQCDMSYCPDMSIFICLIKAVSLTCVPGCRLLYLLYHTTHFCQHNDIGCTLLSLHCT